MLRVLVIDDDPMVSTLLKEHFSNEGFEVTCASTAEEGLTKAKASMPDLILLDVMLPDATGFQTLGWLRQNPVTHTIPVIMMSGTQRHPSQQNIGKNMGADAYVLKPFNVEDVSAQARRLLADKLPAEVPSPEPKSKIVKDSPKPPSLEEELKRLNELPAAPVMDSGPAIQLENWNTELFSPKPIIAAPESNYKVPENVPEPVAESLPEPIVEPEPTPPPAAEPEHILQAMLGALPTPPPTAEPELVPQTIPEPEPSPPPDLTPRVVPLAEGPSLEERCLKFSAGVLDLIARLPANLAGENMADQLMRTAVLVGADIQKSQEAALEKIQQSRYWLALIRQCSLMEKARLVPIEQASLEIEVLLKSALASRTEF